MQEKVEFGVLFFNNIFSKTIHRMVTDFYLQTGFKNIILSKKFGNVFELCIIFMFYGSKE